MKKIKFVPRVSVLMPAYNVEKYVGEAIESILNQTFKDFEFIVINDGSTDDTAKIIQEYAKKDKRIHFINHKKNRGIADVRNELLNMAVGEYCAYQDSDDISLPDRLRIQVDFLDKNPEISVVSASLRTIPQNEDWHIIKNPGILDFYVANPIPNAVAMFRKKDIEKYGLSYNKKYKTAEDYDFWQRVARVMKIRVLPDVLYMYRILDTSLSHKNNKLVNHFDNIIRADLLDFLTGDAFLRMKIAPKYYVMLFGFIPLFKVKRKHIYLFGFIPLLKIHNMWCYLFDFIPIFKLKI